MTTHPGPLLGVIGLPDLVAACPAAGLRAVTDPHPPSAVSAIQVALETADFPVIVDPADLDRVAAWLPALSERTHVTVAALPSTLGDLLAQAGYSGIDPQLAATPLDVTGTLPTPLPQAPLPQATAQATADPVHTSPTAPAETPVPAAEAHPPADGDPSPAAAPNPDPQVEGQDDGPADPPTGAPVDASQVAASQELPSVGGELLTQLSGPGKVAVTWSGKGGVGKTTFAFALAQRAAAAGLRVALIDANIGQPDLRTILRAGSSSLPSVYQAAISGSPEGAFVDPDRLNASRPLKLERLEFTVVQGPPPHVPDPDRVTPAVYRDVVAYARRHYDLVVLDTQIVETIDRFGMVTGLLAPLLQTPGTWGVAISDSSATGVTNLLTRLKAFARLGVAAHTQLGILNRVPVSEAAEIPGVAAALAENATFLGAVHSDDQLAAHLNRGRPVSDLNALREVLDAALLTITGNTAFAAPAPTPEPASKKTKPTPAAPSAPTAPERSTSFFVRLMRRR